jgi:hypothetical protein
VMGDGQQTLDRRKRRDKLDDRIHSDLVRSRLRGALTIRNGLNPTLAENGRRRLSGCRMRALEQHWERFVRQE